MNFAKVFSHWVVVSLPLYPLLPRSLLASWGLICQLFGLCFMLLESFSGSPCPSCIGNCFPLASTSITLASLWPNYPTEMCKGRKALLWLMVSEQSSTSQGGGRERIRGGGNISQSPSACKPESKDLRIGSRNRYSFQRLPFFFQPSPTSSLPLPLNLYHKLGTEYLSMILWGTF